MRKVRRYGIIGLSCLLLTGCNSSQSAGQYQKIEESVTAEIEKETRDSDDVTVHQDDQEVLDNSLIWYVPDSHFYETTPQPFTVLDKILGHGEEVVYSLEILEAFTSKNPADGGEYFETSRLQKLINWQEGEGRDTILFVKVRLTNPGVVAEEVSMYDLGMYKRVPGDIKNEFSDQCLESIHDGLDYDRPMTLGDNFYLIKIEPGESLETTVAYWVSADDLKENLYMQCFDTYGADMGVYNVSKERWEPNNDENVRFVRVHVKE